MGRAGADGEAEAAAGPQCPLSPPLVLVPILPPPMMCGLLGPSRHERWSLWGGWETDAPSSRSPGSRAHVS